MTSPSGRMRISPLSSSKVTPPPRSRPTARRMSAGKLTRPDSVTRPRVAFMARISMVA